MLPPTENWLNITLSTTTWELNSKLLQTNQTSKMFIKKTEHRAPSRRKNVDTKKQALSAKTFSSRVAQRVAAMLLHTVD